VSQKEFVIWKERGRQAGQQAVRFKFRLSFGKIEGRYRGIVRHRNKETELT
jgi:hypothetical protein